LLSELFKIIDPNYYRSFKQAWEIKPQKNQTLSYLVCSSGKHRIIEPKWVCEWFFESGWIWN